MRRAGTLAVLVLGCGIAFAAAPSTATYRFSYDHILGTSLDLSIVARGPAQAEDCAAALLDEIERLRKILSTYDPASEVSRLNASADAVPVGRELGEVLALYEAWRLRTGGVFNGQLGTLTSLWKAAQKTGEIPDAAELLKIVGEIDGPAVDLDVERGTARRRSSQQLNINALGKNYILARALRAGRIDGIDGLLVDLGGDLFCWGEMPWRIGLADPRSCYDNLLPRHRILLRNQAVASSGGYARPMVIGDRSYSQIFDPRTGRPAEGVLGASVVAPDPVTADALSTTLCILSPKQGLELIASLPGTACAIIDSDGNRHVSPDWPAVDAPVEIQQKNSAWPEKFQLTIDLALAKTPPLPNGKPYRRPYVAVWIEDANRRPVRTITVWGNEAKYQKDLSEWWAFGGKDAELVKSVSRATRDGGRYTLAWDGLDDKGKALPQGVYLVRVEVHREFGRHIKDMGVAVPCRAKAVAGEIKGNVEVDGVKVKYGPEGK